MAGPDHGDHLVVEDRHERQVGVIRHHAHQHQVVAAFGKALQSLAAVAYVQANLYLRVAGTKPRQDMRHHILGGRDCRQVELAANGAGQFGELHLQARYLAEYRLGRGRQGIGGGQYVQGLAGVLEQRLFQGLLELTDLRADRRLGQAELLRGPRIGLLAVHGLEDLKLAKGQAVEQMRARHGDFRSRYKPSLIGWQKNINFSIGSPPGSVKSTPNTVAAACEQPVSVSHGHRGRNPGGPSVFRKLLIANRGEIAVRIVRACAEMDIRSVAVYTEPDRFALHVKRADEAHFVGDDPLAGYLDAQRLVDLARETGCDAIHPGYGFLSENADLARICSEAGIAFVGPSAAVIARMGDKTAARAAMREAGVPVTPGSEDNLASCRRGPGTGRVDRLPGDAQGHFRRRRPRHSPL